MPSTHDPDHARGASLVLPGEAEETDHSAPARKESTVKDARSPARLWLGLAALSSGLAVLAAVLIFFSAWPGALAAELFGAGLALLAICALLLSGAWRSARSHPITPAAPGGPP